MKVLDTALYDQGFDHAVTEFILLLKQKKENRLISPSDANVLVEAKINPDFKKVLEQYYWNLPDGIPSVWILKLKGAKNAARCSGPDFFKAIIVQTAGLPIRHFLCGGAAGVAEQLAESCKKWGNSNISGTFCPPFEGMKEPEMKYLGQTINQSKTNIVWVGLGAPKQIYFSHKLSSYCTVHAILPVGAAFDFHTGKIKKAPLWLQKLGLEWFYRLLKEPKRLFKRYRKVVPAFLLYGMVDLLSFYFKKIFYKSNS